MNQQFFLPNAAFTYNGQIYANYYQTLIKQAIYAARRGNAEVIILDLHWSDCGCPNPLHVQSGAGICGDGYGNINGIYGNIGQQMLPDANSVKFWSLMCDVFSTSEFPDVMFELYNEPFPWQNPNVTPSTNFSTPNVPYVGNENKIWNAWLNGDKIPTPTLMNSNSSQPTSSMTCASAITEMVYYNASYVGMQDLYNVVHAKQPDRVCIVGGPQFSYRLDGVLGSLSGPTSSKTVFSTPYQYAIKGADGNPAPNVLYNAHPYTSQLSPSTLYGNYPDLSQFYNAFGIFSNYSDFVCTEFGNNQGSLVGNTIGACNAVWQYQIQSYLDGQIVGSAPPLNKAHLPSYTAWAWYAGDCAFPSMIGLSPEISTNVDSIPAYDKAAYETGQVLGKRTCMGDPTYQSMRWRAAGSKGSYPTQSTDCSQSSCPTVGKSC